MVDITNSLRTGIMDSSMIWNFCRHYQIQELTGNDVKAEPYYYISRSEPNNLKQITSPSYVRSICKHKLEDTMGGFKYDPGEEDTIDMQYYFVSNPDYPGAVGISIELTDEKRVMITSGGLSGCGFAVLRNDYGKVYVIHAGASNSFPNVNAADIDIRRQMINRDIYLMAVALQMPDCYNKWLSYKGKDMDIQNGLTCEALFERLQECELEGITYVCRENKQLVCDADGMRLAVRSYTSHAFHDVVAVINERGKMASTLRNLEDAKGGMKVTKSIQNQLCQRS